MWHGVDARLVTHPAELLHPQLRLQDCVADVEGRIYIDDAQRRIVPDSAVSERPPHTTRVTETAVLEADEPMLVRIGREPEIRERYWRSFDAQGRQLITQIEFIRHTDKHSERGRAPYQQKRDKLRQAGVHLVEIDPLRAERRWLGGRSAPVPSIARRGPSI